MNHVKRFIIESNKSFVTSTPSQPQGDQVGLKQGSSTSPEDYILEQFEFIWRHFSHKFDSQEEAAKKCEIAEGGDLLEEGISKFWGLSLSHSCGLTRIFAGRTKILLGRIC